MPSLLRKKKIDIQSLFFNLKKMLKARHLYVVPENDHCSYFEKWSPEAGLEFNTDVTKATAFIVVVLVLVGAPSKVS